MSIWPATLSVKNASKLMWRFPPTFLGALVNTTAFTLLLESFAEKKTIQLRGASKHRQILALCFLTDFAHFSS